jgi:hypothetical protein
MSDGELASVLTLLDAGGDGKVGLEVSIWKCV